MNVLKFIITYKRTNNANNATDYVKLGETRRESSKHIYYIISPRVIIKAIIIDGQSHGAISCILGGESSENPNLRLQRLRTRSCHESERLV